MSKRFRLASGGEVLMLKLTTMDDSTANIFSSCIDVVSWGVVLAGTSLNELQRSEQLQFICQLEMVTKRTSREECSLGNRLYERGC